MLKPEQRSLVLDNTKTNYLEVAAYATFKLDIMDLISLKAQLAKAFSIQPSEVDKMPFWEFELYIKEIERLVNEENKQQQDQFNQSGGREAMSMAKDPSKFVANQQKSMMPKMPNMNMPSTIKMPSYH